MARAYLDHASSSPLRPVALDAMLPFLRDHHADPGRLHAEGRVTRVALEGARERVAAFFGARPREVVFTGSGTEAVNTAIWGALRRVPGRSHVVTTEVEHSSVRDAIARSGADVSVIGVDRTGRFDPAEVIDALRPETRLVSVQLANHEVGSRQPVGAIGAAARERGAIVHLDACATAGHAPIDFRALDVDLCSITAHKLGGPKGAGALLVRRGLRLDPFLVGGAQERARRAGIEDVPAWVGFGAACNAIDLPAEIAAQHELIAAASRVTELVAGVDRLGPADAASALPNILCLGVVGVEAEPILLALDQHGVAVHSGSSCSSETLEPSPVLAAMGVDAERSLRISVGWSTTASEVDQFVKVFPGIVDRLRGLRAP